MTKDEVYSLETAMYNAAKNRDVEAFLKVVSEDAVMVCGGYRCTGKDYAQFISEYDCKNYSFKNFEVVNETEVSIQVHYVLELTVNEPQNIDLAGTFQVTTTWRKLGEEWKVVFNMDHKILEP